jgi:DNA repair protein RadA
VYIDTEGKVRPERIEQIAKSRGFDPDKTLENIIIQEPQNIKEQELLLNDAEILIHSQNIKLMIVDSIIAHYKTEYCGRANLPERQQRLYQFMRSLQKIAHSLDVAVIVTNHVQANPDIFGRRPIAAGGNALAHASTYVVLIRPSGKDRTALMISSPYHPVRDTVFTICERGIDNTEEEDFHSPRKTRY